MGLWQLTHRLIIKGENTAHLHYSSIISLKDEIQIIFGHAHIFHWRGQPVLGWFYKAFYRVPIKWVKRIYENYTSVCYIEKKAYPTQLRTTSQIYVDMYVHLSVCLSICTEL